MASQTEAQTRKLSIDQQLAQAGWSSTFRDANLLQEYRLRKLKSFAESSSNYGSGDEFADYALLGKDHKPLAIVEAKRMSRDALSGKRQASDYADLIQEIDGRDVFIFLTNGQEIWFWDRNGSPPRKVSGFFGPDDLERLVFQKQYRQSLLGLNPLPAIADRPYQVEAIKRVTESIMQSRRKFLLVMATGTGKTRTVIALVELLMRAKWVQRVLFLADRRELVRQAMSDFKERLPSEARTRIESDLNEAERDAARIHFATYPGMMQAYSKLSPAYYDLIIADESHRSIYNRYKALFEHFDAMQLGLTATPTDFIDHDTFELFDCDKDLPTFYYSLDTAVSEDYLVKYKVLQAQTNFQLKGIKYGELPPELQREVNERGLDPDDINFEGTDLERRVTNTGTNDALVRELMHSSRKDATGTLPAKTIVFAMSHRHAVALWESFNRLYPDLQRRGLAEVIDSQMERADKLIEDFKRNDMPRVAISVDMLDTGIDVPAIQNLVFAKPVFSLVKFNQMIGRGTRKWTDPQTGDIKRDFLIIDHWNNFDYFRLSPEGEVQKTMEPLPTRLFRLRMQKLQRLLAEREDTEAAATIQDLQAMLAQLPTSNVSIQPHIDELQALNMTSQWYSLEQAQIDRIQNVIAPLLRYLPDVSMAEMVFEVRTEQLALAHLNADFGSISGLREKICDDLKRLSDEVREVREQRELRLWAMSDGFWAHLEYDRIMQLQHVFAPLMRFRQRQSRDMIELDLPDTLATRRWVIYGPAGEGAYAERYRQQIEAYVRELAEWHPALLKIKRGEALTDEDIEQLAGALNSPDFFITDEVLRDVYEQSQASVEAFVRHVLGLSSIADRETRIRAEFDRFIAAHPHFSAAQINFVRMVRMAVLRRAQLTTETLSREPFSRAGNAQVLFSAGELAEMTQLAQKLAA